MKVVGAPLVNPAEYQFVAIRAQGAGGQNVNKVSSAVQLRFDIKASSLPEWVKQRLLKLSDQRINSEGVLVIKAQNSRSQPKNKEDAVMRLESLVAEASKRVARRIPTKPSKAAKRKRLDEKTRRSTTKNLRGKVRDE